MPSLTTPVHQHFLHQRVGTDTDAADAAPWAWTVAAHQATTLAADAAPRWLHVDDGCVWITRRDGDDLASDRASDIWLAAGDSLALPAHSAWVLEAWPRARLSLLQQAPAGFSAAASRGPWQPAPTAGLARWLQPAWLRGWMTSAAA